MPPRRACDVCYKRKIQCLIRAPGDPCDWCKSQGQTCTFDRVIQKDPNKRTTSDVVQELSHRVEKLEDALRSALSTNTPAGPSPWSEGPFLEESSRIPYFSTSLATVTGQRSALSLPTAPTTAGTPRSEPAYKLSRCQVGNNWYFKGVGLLSSRGRQWISEGTGQSVFLENFDLFDNPVGARPCLTSPFLPERARSLPPEPTCNDLFDIFLRSKTFIVFPILDGGLFEDAIARAYDTASDGLSRASTEACLWAMIALAVRTEEAQQLDSLPEAEDCVQEVRRLLSLVNGAANLDILEATLLLWVYQKLKGKCRDASITFTSACRMVCDLGGHILLPDLAILPQHIPIFDQQSRLHIRGLFWLCYCFDKDASLRTGSPLLLTSDYCDLSGPGEHSNQAARYNQSRDTNLAQSELLAHVRQIDDELEEWRLSIEPGYRPRLSILSDSSLSVSRAMSPEDRTHAINLQLDYLFTMINIHTLVRKCGDLERNLPDDLHSVVHSSADLSIEASRSIFRFLETVVDFWQEDSVWVVSHYAPMAAMPLFLNIIIHPLGNPADSDLQILSSIGNITRKIPTERLSREEIEHIQEIGEFVMQLIQLGHSAAWKAKKGEREHDLDIIHR
ncbi:hypothetical protein P170DRAFT_451880 [Aspergillus steynii IBT 23096]|uniref:Zn(2)-C6 fungal-type domain-containing protein n=1 Tax=Aspergillus steynii IBT 23096 TaxID=1392250 RepID=A0A2I2GM55_9EURO|nr:uncharacterized protein P170DRAFT_451880 [Aspergillus steynii IBT 23096]PLB53971.1 hypothetical protein P170DRAFT_451880 [Aspergillus steynii IBT 23096]